MLTELTTAEKVVGAKQTKRALTGGRVTKVFFAKDADPRVITQVETMCTQQGIEVSREATMRELGSACGIAVGCAVAAIIK